jgi:hypothetical protein
MKRFIPFVVGSLLLIAGGAPPAQAETPPPPPNAIVSEGNGAAVFIGYGADRSVELSWRPSKKYEAATMLYQVQRTDGAMLESKTSASKFTDVNLTHNTSYGYRLITFQSIKKKYTVTRGPSKGQVIYRTQTKRVGTNEINVLTLPSMVVGLTASVVGGAATLTWQPPQYSANPVGISVVIGGNVMAYDITTGTYSFPGTCGTSYAVVVVVENASGPADDNANLSVKMPKCA